MLNKQARNFTKQMNLILVKTHYKSYKSIKQNVHHVNYYFHEGISNSYYFGFSEGGVYESRSPIYIYVRAEGRPSGGLSHAILIIYLAVVVSSPPDQSR